VAATLFRSLADADVNVDMIVQNVSEGGVTDISFTVPHAQIDDAIAVCEERAAEVGAAAVVTDRAIANVSVIGAGLKSKPGVAAPMFQGLSSNGSNSQLLSTSPVRTSCVIAEAASDRPVHLLHDAYELESNTF